MNRDSETRVDLEVEENPPSQDRFSEKLRPLFVGGCQRSGTTAFTDYLNQHPEILVCQERYKRIAREQIKPNLFTFERILDYRRGETNKPWNLEYYVRRHAEILARKDPARLKWIGDKNPGFVKNMPLLVQNNPGARFIMLYRPVEEVAESWDARSKDPDDHWLTGLDGFALGVETWNTALRRLREFIESSPVPRVLIVSYRDFFCNAESYAPVISRFLGIEFDESVIEAWEEMSRRFEDERRRKMPLAEEQAAFIEEHADRAAEGWIRDRIARQWGEPGLYVQEDKETALASLAEMEARAWRLQRQVNELEERLTEKSRTNQRLRRRVANLNRRIAGIQGSRPWRLIQRLERIRMKVVGAG